MKAIRVSNIFGCDWKSWAHADDYDGHEHEFKYKGMEYLPLEVVSEYKYLFREVDIEDVDVEVI